MLCDFFRRRLLASERPSRPPDDVMAHLGRCAACRSWHARLLEMEALVPRLPVPRTDALTTLLDHIATAPMGLPMTPVAPARSRRWHLVAGAALAASVLIACGIFLGNGVWQALKGPDRQSARSTDEDDKSRKQARPDARQDTLVGHLVRCDLRLARAGNAEERVRALADLANGLRGESQLLARAAGAHELDRLARLYGKVIREGVVTRSVAVPASERQRVLAPIVADLARAERDVEQLAGKAPASAEALRLIAAAAREGEARLRELMGRES
jgi:hypothetical protein